MDNNPLNASQIVAMSRDNNASELSWITRVAPKSENKSAPTQTRNGNPIQDESDYFQFYF